MIIFLIGIMISPTSLIIPLYINLKPLGLINTHLGVILSLTALGIPFGVFLLRIHCQYIPQELLDAAKIDGCSNFKVFVRILFPLVMPGIRATALIELLWAWNNYLVPLVLIQKDEFKPLTVALDVFTTRFTTHYPFLATASVLTFLPILIIYLATQRSFIRGVSTGAFK
jgi:raffinose/stachyose/melibiose transport system permease protein